MKRVWGFAGLLVAATIGGWMIFSDPAPRLDAADADLVSLGRSLYAEHCGSCHGSSLEGQPNWRERQPNGRLPAPPHDPSGHTWHHSDVVLFRIVKDGIASVAPPGYESDMPAYGDVLSDREIIAILSFIKAQWPRDIQARQESITRQTGG